MSNGNDQRSVGERIARELKAFPTSNEIKRIDAALADFRASILAELRQKDQGAGEGASIDQLDPGKDEAQRPTSFGGDTAVITSESPEIHAQVKVGSSIPDPCRQKRQSVRTHDEPRRETLPIKSGMDAPSPPAWTVESAAARLEEIAKNGHPCFGVEDQIDLRSIAAFLRTPATVAAEPMAEVNRLHRVIDQLDQRVDDLGLQLEASNERVAVLAADLKEANSDKVSNAKNAAAKETAATQLVSVTLDDINDAVCQNYRLSIGVKVMANVNYGDCFMEKKHALRIAEIVKRELERTPYRAGGCAKESATGDPTGENANFAAKYREACAERDKLIRDLADEHRRGDDVRKVADMALDQRDKSLRDLADEVGKKTAERERADRANEVIRRKNDDITELAAKLKKAEDRCQAIAALQLAEACKANARIAELEQGAARWKALYEGELETSRLQLKRITETENANNHWKDHADELEKTIYAQAAEIESGKECVAQLERDKRHQGEEIGKLHSQLQATQATDRDSLEELRTQLKAARDERSRAWGLNTSLNGQLAIVCGHRDDLSEQLKESERVSEARKALLLKTARERNEYHEQLKAATGEK